MTAMWVFLYVVGFLGMTRVFIVGYRLYDPGAANTAASLGLLIAWPLLWLVVCLKATWIMFSKGTMPE